MIDAFVTSFKIKNTYMVNSIIYWIKRLPILGKLIPDSLYKSEVIKIIANVISALIELGTFFVGKFVYVFALFMVASINNGNISGEFLQIYMLLAVAGTVLNSQLFNPSKDKFYAIVLLKMNPKKFTLANYSYFLLKMFIGFLPAVLVISMMLGLKWYFVILLPLFTVCAKVIANYIMLNISVKTGKTISENNLSPFRWALVLGLSALAVGLSIAQIIVNEAVVLAVIGAAVLAFIPASLFLWKFNGYGRVYKSLLGNATIILDRKKYVADVGKANLLKSIENTGTTVSAKSGYGYFNDIFTQRHRKILTRSAKNTALVLLAILAVAVGALLYKREYGASVNKLMLNALPYFVFVMYAINRGQIITRAMFLNCDQSMLSYRFYRKPTAILALFMERLKTLVKINLLPTSVIALGLPLILYISGGTDNPLNYLVLFLSIIFVSVFYSVHHLVIYYLLQPYNADVEIKSPLYNAINGITYGLSFLCIYIKVPTMIFGSCIIAFAVIYVVVSLFLAYKLAPKTFKLR